MQEPCQGKNHVKNWGRTSSGLERPDVDAKEDIDGEKQDTIQRLLGLREGKCVAT